MVKVKPYNKTIAEIRSEFNKVYHKSIAPTLRAWEVHRRKELRRYYTKLILAIFVGIIFCCIFYKFPAVCFMALIFIFIFVSIPLRKISKAFAQDFKKSCIPVVVDAFGNMAWYPQSEMLLDSEIITSELFTSYNKRYNDDVFIGNYKGVQYTISETRLVKVTRSSKGRRSSTLVFNGVLIVFDSNKNVKNKTIITTKGDLTPRRYEATIAFIVLMLLALGSFLYFVRFDAELFGNFLILLVALIFGLIFGRKNPKERLNSIDLEDPGFNKFYRAYSTDQVEGRYLITPTFMERFKNLHTTFRTPRAKCSFYKIGDSKDRIMFAISTRNNLFEIGNLFTPLTNTKHLTTFFNELSSVLALIDYFKFDEKTGL